MERETGLEPATACLEGRNSTRLSYSRLSFKYTNPRRLSLRFCHYRMKRKASQLVPHLSTIIPAHTGIHTSAY